MAAFVGVMGGAVVTVEMAPAKIAMARANFARAGLAGHIDQREGDAGALLAGPADEGLLPVPLAVVDGMVVIDPGA